MGWSWGEWVGGGLKRGLVARSMAIAGFDWTVIALRTAYERYFGEPLGRGRRREGALGGKRQTSSGCEPGAKIWQSGGCAGICDVEKVGGLTQGRGRLNSSPCQ